MRNNSHINKTINEVNKLLKLEKNIFKKIRKIEKPIARFIANFDTSWEVRVLKIYQLPHKHTDFSAWYTVAKSNNTFGSWEYGDQYAKDIASGHFDYKDGEDDFVKYFINNKDFPYSDSYAFMNIKEKDNDNVFFRHSIKFS